MVHIRGTSSAYNGAVMKSVFLSHYPYIISTLSTYNPIELFSSHCAKHFTSSLTLTTHNNIRTKEVDVKFNAYGSVCPCSKHSAVRPRFYWSTQVYTHAQCATLSRVYPNTGSVCPLLYYTLFEESWYLNKIPFYF